MHTLQKSVAASGTITTQPTPDARAMNLEIGTPSAPLLGGSSLPNTTCPPGLEYLIPLDHILLKQRLHTFAEHLSGDVKNEYIVLNKEGQRIYSLFEESSKWARCCYGSMREFEIRVFDSNNREVINMVRPYKCDSCWDPANGQELSIYSNNMLMGKVVQETVCFGIKYRIYDHNEEYVLRISSSICRCGPPVMKLKSIAGNHQLGLIQKNWAGFFPEFEVFGISFPLDLDVRMKAVMLGACILMDIMYYEKQR